ncbi:MAG: DinB family protein [Acidimicrobiales bacterium]
MARSNIKTTMVDDLTDPRREEPAFVLDERMMLESWLEFHRVTLELKCEGLSEEQLRRRPVETSALSLHGLVRHMAEVERAWFRRVLPIQPELPRIWCTAENPELDLFPLNNASWSTDLSVWRAECALAREAAAAFSLDDTGMRHDQPCSLRWIYNHMIEEYARHNGHADLIREMIDGAVGW